jgi:hypothetical protein
VWQAEVGVGAGAATVGAGGSDREVKMSGGFRAGDRRSAGPLHPCWALIIFGSGLGLRAGCWR